MRSLQLFADKRVETIIKASGHSSRLQAQGYHLDATSQQQQTATLKLSTQRLAVFRVTLCRAMSVMLLRLKFFVRRNSVFRVATVGTAAKSPKFPFQAGLLTAGAGGARRAEAADSRRPPKKRVPQHLSSKCCAGCGKRVFSSKLTRIYQGLSGMNPILLQAFAIFCKCTSRLKCVLKLAIYIYIYSTEATYACLQVLSLLSCT